MLFFVLHSGHIPVGVHEESGKLTDGGYLVYAEAHFGVPALHPLHLAPPDTWKTIECVVYSCL